MFWGLVLKTNKRYSQQVTKAFHVSQAVLDLSTVNSNDNDAVVQVWLNTDETDHLIANVSRQTSHVQLDLTFTEGETVAFYSKGSATVHLTGYLLPDDDFGDFPGEEEEESDEEVQAPTKQKLQKKPSAVKGEEEEVEDSDDDEDDSDIDFEALPEGFDEEEVEDEEDSDEDDEDDDDEDDDDDDEEDEEDSDEIEAPQSKKVKLDKAAKQNGLTNGKLSKKENEKQKNQQKNQKQDKQQEQKQKQSQQQQQNQQKKPTPKTLKGGVTVEDLRVGKGPEAQVGKKVSVYYEGRLKSNNKMFDSTKVGDGFKFTLGRGDVIQGWDIGVVGMKVGSKRRITCPPHVAYGNKGAPPQIPANATLVFDVELRNVK